MTHSSDFSLEWSVEIFTKPFPGKGQDAFNISSGCISVADGATPLNKEWPQDVAEFAQAACTRVNQYLKSTDMENAFEAAVRDLRERFVPAGYKRSAGIASVQLKHSKITFGALGDVAFYIKANGSVTRVRDERLVTLDLHARNSGDLETFLENRKLLNLSGGYPIFADDPGAARSITATKFETSNVDAFIVSTDGGWNLFDGRAAEFIESCESFGLKVSVERFVDSQSFSFDDDATIVFAMKSQGIFTQ